jgi:fumarylacetoacetase
MTSPDYQSHFSIANIPFGVASSDSHPKPQCVTRLENNVIFLAELQRAGLFSEIASLPEGVFDKPSLNEYAALPKVTQREVRKLLQEALAESLPTGFTEDISAVTLHMPVSVGGFTGMLTVCLLIIDGQRGLIFNRLLVQPAPRSERRPSYPQ